MGYENLFWLLTDVAVVLLVVSGMLCLVVMIACETVTMVLSTLDDVGCWYEKWHKKEGKGDRDTTDPNMKWWTILP